MNRPFDYKWTWLDDEGKPLAGKVEFCKLHTTVLENIYDNQGYPIPCAGTSTSATAT